MTPLKNAYRINSDSKKHPGSLILSHPTKFMNALFVPHTRDKTTMKAILSSEEAANSRALFVHADVKGASMNDLIKSQNGISADYFPSGRSVYSGHFHKPHIVSTNGGSEIRYVGSPYQTSLSEAGQQKALLLVDSQKDWSCIEEIDLNIGPRHHRITSLPSFLKCSSEMLLRSGDKISLVIPQKDLDEIRIGNLDSSTSFDSTIDELRDAGVAVEIRNSQAEPVENVLPTNNGAHDEEIVELEDLSPIATLEAYIKNEVETDALKESTADTLLKDGIAILDEVSNNSNQNEAASAYRSKAHVTIELDSVSMVSAPFLVLHIFVHTIILS